MKQEILTLEQGQVADMLLSLKNSHRRINRFLQEYTPPLNGDRYLTDKEVAEVLKVSRRTLQNLRNNRMLPFILLGGKALYREYDIQRLLEANYRKADGCSVDIYHWDIIVALAYRINTFYAHAFRKWLKETATKEKDKETHQAIIIPLWTFGNN